MNTTGRQTRRDLATAIGDAHALDYAIADEIVDYILGDELAELRSAQAVAAATSGLYAIAAAIDSARTAILDASNRLDRLADTVTRAELEVES